MHKKDIVYAGERPEKANKAIILLHGRGASAENILTLAEHLHLPGFAVMAPRASQNTWYPYSFLYPESENQPWLDSALDLLASIEDEIYAHGLKSKDLYFAGFSQGACLSLEYTARHAKPYGGVVAFTGGLIGHTVNQKKYNGDFQQTPVYIGTSDPDPHIPVDRVRDSEAVFKNMNARTTVEIYPGIGHTIVEEEIRKVNAIFFEH